MSGVRMEHEYGGITLSGLASALILCKERGLDATDIVILDRVFAAGEVTVMVLIDAIGFVSEATTHARIKKLVEMEYLQKRAVEENERNKIILPGRNMEKLRDELRDVT